jgi:hypothetical protein
VVLVERSPQLGLQLQTGQRRRVHPRHERRVPVLPAGLGRVHRQVRPSQQVAGYLVRCRTEGDPDAGPDHQLGALDDQRRPHDLEDALGDGMLAVMAHVLEEDGELVAAQAGDGVDRPQALPDPLGHLDQQLVPGGVAEAVVDGLEAVEVQEQHRDGRHQARGARQRQAEAVEEQRPVRQLCERVVQGGAGELLGDGLGLQAGAALALVPAPQPPDLSLVRLAHAPTGARSCRPARSARRRAACSSAARW